MNAPRSSQPVLPRALVHSLGLALIAVALAGFGGALDTLTGAEPTLESAESIAIVPANVDSPASTQLQVKAGLPKIRFHDLRHTAASLMLNNGIDVLVASQRLGHAKPSITLDVYGHLFPNSQIEAANVLEGIIKDV